MHPPACSKPKQAAPAPPTLSPRRPRWGERMKRETVRVRGADLAMFRHDGDSPGAAPLVVWVHGWGHSHANMLPLAQAMPRRHALGIARPAGLRRRAAAARRVGHRRLCRRRRRMARRRARHAARMGGAFLRLPRRACSLAARHPELVDGLFLIAAAGLPPQRSLGGAAADRGAALGLPAGAQPDPGGAGARPPARALRQRRLPPGRSVAADPGQGGRAKTSATWRARCAARRCWSTATATPRRRRNSAPASTD